MYVQTLLSISQEEIPGKFCFKITDCDAENSETGTWLDFSLACNYLSLEKHMFFISRNEEVRRLLNHMQNNPGKY